MKHVLSCSRAGLATKTVWPDGDGFVWRSLRFPAAPCCQKLCFPASEAVLKRIRPVAKCRPCKECDYARPANRATIKQGSHILYGASAARSAVIIAVPVSSARPTQNATNVRTGTSRLALPPTKQCPRRGREEERAGTKEREPLHHQAATGMIFSLHPSPQNSASPPAVHSSLGRDLHLLALDPVQDISDSSHNSVHLRTSCSRLFWPLMLLLRPRACKS